MLIASKWSRAYCGHCTLLRWCLAGRRTGLQPNRHVFIALRAYAALAYIEAACAFRDGPPPLPTREMMMSTSADRTPTTAVPLSPANRFRGARFALVRSLAAQSLEESGRCRIIDIGGLPGYWRAFGADVIADPRVTITFVNLGYTDAERAAADGPEAERFQLVTGNACELSAIPALAFDLAHSNSVIEHVGRWTEMTAMANEIRRVASRHYVQTPYWGFPIEPHNRTPAFHWLPEQWRYRLVLSRKLGFWDRATSVDDAMRRVHSICLVDRRQFAALFPGSSIYSEIVYGLTKSLVAIGGEGLPVDPRSNTRRLRTA